MKIRRFISTIALLFVACGAAAAQAAGGSYQFALEDGLTKYVEFDASAQTGGATGTMFFSDETRVTHQDVDGVGDPSETHAGFFFRAEFDDMQVSGNRAVMAGTVRDSSITGLVGRRVLLTVEDNGEGARDRVTWGLYANSRRDWTPSDAELREDPGVGLTWWAADAERPDDRGYAMPRDESVGARTFPVASYELDDPASASGDIYVRP